MSKRKNWRTALIVIGVLAVVGCVAGLFTGLWPLAMACVIALIIVYYLYQRLGNPSRLDPHIDAMLRNIERANNYAVSGLPVGIAVFDKDGTLQWHNVLLREWLGNGFGNGDSFAEIMPEKLRGKFDTFCLRDQEEAEWVKDRFLRVYFRGVQTGNADNISGLMVYFFDETEKERERLLFEDEKMCIGYLQLDNFSDVTKGLTESAKADLSAEVTRVINLWVDDCKGYMLRYGDDLYQVCLSRKALDATEEKKFDFLDKIHEIKTGNKIPPTVSVGMAAGKSQTLKTLSRQAHSALDLALGRGGDQAVVNKEGEIKFFGARGTVSAHSTKVRARVVAHAIREQMLNSDRIFIMGHDREDFDCIGATLGVARMALRLRKETYIVSSGRPVAPDKLRDLRTEEDMDYAKMVLLEDEALAKLQEDEKKNLLVIVDHHRAVLSAAPKVLEAIPQRVIIDHHRRAEDCIQKAIIPYMEPSSSSSSEMVTELVTYFDERLKLTKFEATILYAGILLDTKNFANQTSERTFEAAAVLRQAGADSHQVQVLFKDDMPTFISKAKVIAALEIPYPGVAVSLLEGAPEGANTSVIISQAADEILTMEGVHVSMVLCPGTEHIGVSARSDGTVNVQVIMEAVGGGGHLTVAGGQVKDILPSDLKNRLVAMAVQQLQEKETDKNESNPE